MEKIVEAIKISSLYIDVEDNKEEGYLVVDVLQKRLLSYFAKKVIFEISFFLSIMH